MEVRFLSSRAEIRVDCKKLHDICHIYRLIELHELNKSGITITQIIQDRFKGSHDLVFINHRKYKQSDYLASLGFSQEEHDVLINEYRKYSVGWAFLRPKH